ncbi:MAG: ABC transporter ATP-binding protein [Bacillota bacterium]
MSSSSGYQLKVENLSKVFGRRLIFRDISFCFDQNGIFGIAGHNGSGKSTLVKILTGIIGASRGKATHSLGGKNIPSDQLHDHIGFVAPYLVLYDEFSAEENLRHFANIRNIPYNKEKADNLLNEFLLYDRRFDEVKGYSSGMKQRLKYIFALMHSPSLLVLDEPTSNLDSAGKDTVYKIIKDASSSSIVLVASNEESDLSLCREIIQIEKYKEKS